MRQNTVMGAGGAGSVDTTGHPRDEATRPDDRVLSASTSGHEPEAARASRPGPRSSIADLALHGKNKRAPDGRKLTKAERTSLPTIDALNEGINEAARTVSSIAHSPDVAWVIGQFHNPIALARHRMPKLPEPELLHRVVTRIESEFDGRERPAARPRLTRALNDWYTAMRNRRRDPRWRDVAGTPVTLQGFRAWQDRLADMELSVIPWLNVPAEFERALGMVQDWDDLLHKRGHTGERFSLREEVVRLHNWPGDQWDSGDDYASAQKRFHRRLDKARRLRDDPMRDRIMSRALYLREGLLLNPVDDLEWFLAVCHFRWNAPELLDVRPELASWRLFDWIDRLGRPAVDAPIETFPEWADAPDPRDVPAEALTGVGGPGVMIDLDEDVVTALRPGCRVRRMFIGARGPLGPDWAVYWVESEWGDSRPILDLVESEKLHPRVVFVSDGEPAELAERIRPFLDVAFEIPTNPLTAHSHIPGVVPRIPDHPDAGLS